MYRALILGQILLTFVLTPAVGQPPAPVGGDMSNTTVQATGAPADRKLADRAADAMSPFDFGAVMDGASHPLSTVYASLAAAQAVCPEATALSQEIDWCAVQGLIDHLAALPPVTNEQGVTMPLGGRVRIPGGARLNTGATTLVANNVSLTFEGDDEQGSVVLVSAAPWLAFGLNNQMAVGVATVNARGQGWSVGDALTLTGGTCATPPQITVLSVFDDGGINGTSITTPGSCSVPPSNPLAYTSAGGGINAVINGSFTGAALTSVAFAGTGSGCVNGDTLTAVGGSVPGGAPTAATFSVTNAVGGAIQPAGLSIIQGGSYGTPPPNPVVTTATGACTGALLNLSAWTNRGGSLTLNRLHFSRDDPERATARGAVQRHVPLDASE